MESAAVRLDETGTAYTAQVESIAAGGAGVARLDGRVVFIPRTVPGDTVRFRISADKGKFFRGWLDSVIHPGPSRREPPCPHWTDCGGCPLQQMNPDTQSDAKRRIVHDAFKRIGKFDLTVPLSVLDPPSSEFAYRSRARFQVDEHFIGFFAPESRRLIPLSTCLLVEEPIANALREVEVLLRKNAAAQRIGSIEMTSLGNHPEDGVGLFLYPLGSRDGKKGTINRRTREAWAGFSRSNGWPVAAAGDRRPGQPPEWTARYELEGAHIGSDPLTISVSPEAFIQPNRRGNQALVEAVMKMAGPVDGKGVIDLFCGAGNFSAPLVKRGARVIGLESNPYAVWDAEANCQEIGPTPAVFIRKEAGDLNPADVRESLDGKSPDLLILDPPRKGALEAMSAIMALRPRRIIYVSCNPATMARDAREINEGGYRIDQALVVPMFPNTAHVETVLSWNLTDTSTTFHSNGPAEGSSCS